MSGEFPVDPLTSMWNFNASQIHIYSNANIFMTERLSEERA